MVTSLKPLFPEWYEPDGDTIKLIITMGTVALDDANARKQQPKPA
jgi:hypothetical protein